MWTGAGLYARFDHRVADWRLHPLIHTFGRESLAQNEGTELFAWFDCIEWVGQSSYCPMSRADPFFTRFTASSSLLDPQNPS
jgi:hypothetical protein